MSTFGRKKRLEQRLSMLESQVSETAKTITSIRQSLAQLDALVRQLHADAWNVNALRAEALQNVIHVETSRVQDLVRMLNDDAATAAGARHDDLRSLISQNQADNWAADEKRALSLADVVLLSLDPAIEKMKQEILILVGEKAVEVFREQEHER